VPRGDSGRPKARLTENTTATSNTAGTHRPALQLQQHDRRQPDQERGRKADHRPATLCQNTKTMDDRQVAIVVTKLPRAAAAMKVTS